MRPEELTPEERTRRRRGAQDLTAIVMAARGRRPAGAVTDVNPGPVPIRRQRPILGRAPVGRTPF